MTFSRSAFLGFTAAALVFLLYLLICSRDRLDALEQRQRRRVVLGSIGVIAVIILVLGLVGMFGYVGRTLSSLSEEPHVQESLAALRFIPKHPAGVGMGMVSPKGALTLKQTESRFHVEGSLFQIALEWGIWGLGIWMLFIGINLRNLWRNWKRADYFQDQIFNGMAFTGWTTALVAFIFLPLMQSVNLMVFLWFLMGLASKEISQI